ncbi:hypothetical protein [Nocardia sp. NPDC059228]|uniref:hypothetical protein n=1 Tax=Nocardia sp. NPDC059228 TaxID=3346777 RepID=UPI0036A1C7DE
MTLSWPPRGRPGEQIAAELGVSAAAMCNSRRQFGGIGYTGHLRRGLLVKVGVVGVSVGSVRANSGVVGR